MRLKFANEIRKKKNNTNYKLDYLTNQEIIQEIDNVLNKPKNAIEANDQLDITRKSINKEANLYRTKLKDKFPKYPLQFTKFKYKIFFLI